MGCYRDMGEERGAREREEGRDRDFVGGLGYRSEGGKGEVLVTKTSSGSEGIFCLCTGASKGQISGRD